VTLTPTDLPAAQNAHQMAGTAASRPAAARRASWALGVVCTAQFVLQLDFSVVNVALPTIQHRLDVVPAELQWIVTGYALTFGSLLLLGGQVADVIGRRRLLMTGLSGFAVASVAAGLSGSALVLIGARILQGAAGAMISPSALSLLTTMNPEGPRRNQALGIWQAATAAGATAGILAGGVLTQLLGWRAIFLVNPPIIAVLLALAPRLLPAGAPAGQKRIDLSGSALVTGSLAALIFGLSSGQEHGFGAAPALIGIGAAVTLIGLFVLRERNDRSPLFPPTTFATPTRRAAVIAMLVLGATVAAYVYFASLYLQRVLHFSPIATGAALLPSTITVVMVSSFGTRRLLARFSVKALLVAGLLSVAAGQLWLSQVTAASQYLFAVLPGLLLTAVGIGLAFPTASVAVTSGVDTRDQGLAGAVFVTSQQTGAAVGLAALAAIAAAQTASLTSHSLTAGYSTAWVIAACAAALTAGFVAVTLSTRACQRELGRRERAAGCASPRSESAVPLRQG
jgi:EmrB/QacA subfamily drug resistance transporter